jgi:hypothetical protein
LAPSNGPTHYRASHSINPTDYKCKINRFYGSIVAGDVRLDRHPPNACHQGGAELGIGREGIIVVFWLAGCARRSA